MVLEDVKVTVYTEDGRSFVISGKQGKVSLESKDMDLQGDVVVTPRMDTAYGPKSVAYRHLEKKAGTLILRLMANRFAGGDCQYGRE
jgi:hypothetical protein